MCPNEFKRLGDCPSDVSFFHNDDLLDTVPIDPETVICIRTCRTRSAIPFSKKALGCDLPLPGRVLIA
jgi:hypothetical protein